MKKFDAKIFIIPPANYVCGGVYCFHVVHPSVFPSMCSHERIHMWLVMSIFNTWVANDSCEASHFRVFIWTYKWYKGGNPSNFKKKYHLKLELLMSICRDFHILMWLSPVLVHTSCCLLLSGYSMSIYYVACFYVAHKSFPIEKCHVFIAF